MLFRSGELARLVGEPGGRGDGGSTHHQARLPGVGGQGLLYLSACPLSGNALKWGIGAQEEGLALDLKVELLL